MKRIRIKKTGNSENFFPKRDIKYKVVRKKVHGKMVDVKVYESLQPVESSTVTYPMFEDE